MAGKKLQNSSKQGQVNVLYTHTRHTDFFLKKRVYIYIYVYISLSIATYLMFGISMI